MVGAPRLTGLVVCKNEARHIEACLESLHFCDELVVVDSGSVDGTLDRIRRFPVRLFERPFVNCNDQKEFGRTVSRGEWLLNLDADERVSPELGDEIRRTIDSPDPAAAFAIPFRNHFRGVWVRRSGYYPDRHIRLMRRLLGRWDRTQPVHDRVAVDGPVGRLDEHIDHYSFDSLNQFVEKSSRYAQGFAEAAYNDGRRTHVAGILGHTAWRFIRAYFVKGGILEGGLGATISGLQAYEVFQKYARLWELGRFSVDRVVTD
jgi:glycosyltransferase involved in cell wall biosynthesis